MTFGSSWRQEKHDSGSAFHSGNAAWSMIPATSQDRREEEALFELVGKMVTSASIASRQHNLKSAATSLRRAYSIASKKVENGLLAGRVARASVAVQHCALLSKFGRHTLALKEALAAARESEEVWSILMQAAVARDDAAKRGDVGRPEYTPYGLLLKAPPPWIRKAIVALVQAKHCVAIELEYSVAGKAGQFSQHHEVEMVRGQLIPALHREATVLSQQLLPEGHPIRQLSERTQAREVTRRVGDPEPRSHSRPFTAPDGGMYGLPTDDMEGVWTEHKFPRADIPQTWTLQPELPITQQTKPMQGWLPPTALDDSSPLNGDTYGAPSPSMPGGPGGSRPTSATGSAASKGFSGHSRPTSAAMSRPASAARIHKLEDQALIRPPDSAWPEDVQDEEDQRLMHMRPHLSSWADPEAGQADVAPNGKCILTDEHQRQESECSSSIVHHIVPSPKLREQVRKQPRGARPQVRGEDEGPKDIFAEWVQGNVPNGQKARTLQRLETEDGVKELKTEMKRESYRLKYEDLPLKSPEEIMENKIMYSKHGMLVAKQAAKIHHPERVASDGALDKKTQAANHVRRVRALRGIGAQLQDSAAEATASPHGRSSPTGREFAQFLRK